VTAGLAGDLVLDPEAIAAADREIGLRLVADALVWVSGAAYRPRLARLVPVYEAVAAGQVGAGLTLHGCVLRRWRGGVAVRREPARVAGPAAPEAVWDGRWRRVSGRRRPAIPSSSRRRARRR
jgi:tRNA(Ile)-lysidine synthase